MGDIVGLEEVNLVVENFAGKYRVDWSLLKAEVESIGRTDEDENVVTANVNLIVLDAAVIGNRAFQQSKNLWKVTATRASEVGYRAFCLCENLTEAILPNTCRLRSEAFLHCFALRHVTLRRRVPHDSLHKTAFFACFSLHALTALHGFVKDSKTDDTSVLTRSYVLWRDEQNKEQRDVFLTYNLMLKLCTHHIDKNTDVIRTRPHDHLTKFLHNHKELASHILSFFGMNRGINDLRCTSKQELRQKALKVEAPYITESWWDEE